MSGLYALPGGRKVPDWPMVVTTLCIAVLCLLLALRCMTWAVETDDQAYTLRRENKILRYMLWVAQGEKPAPDLTEAGE